MTNIFDLLLDGQSVEAGKRQGEKNTDPSVEYHECVPKCSFDLLWRALNACRVGYSPMGGHRLTRPYRAHLFRRVVAHRENKIHFGRAGAGEFSPILTSQTDSWKIGDPYLAKGRWMHSAFRVTSGTICGEFRKSLLVHDSFSHDGASGIAGAQKQNVVAVWHREFVDAAIPRED
jgi:hypothetical protein